MERHSYWKCRYFIIRLCESRRQLDRVINLILLSVVAGISLDIANREFVNSVLSFEIGSEQ